MYYANNKLQTGGHIMNLVICSSPSISGGTCTNVKYRGSGSTTLNNSYSFVPSVGQTDNYTVYIVIVANPTAFAGSYSTGSFSNQLAVTY
jgi:hypothetical protein